MHDIRESIPKTDQTLPGKFPQYEFRPFPRMLLDEHSKPLLGADKQPVIAFSEDEYNSLRAKHYKEPKSAPTVASLASESEELVALRAELAALKAVSERRKPGRKPRVQAEETVD